MAIETIFQNWIFTKFILPFALIVTLVYAILEKTKLLGDGKHQLNAIISFVIGISFTGFLAGTEIVSNMVLFLSIALVVLFVILMLWGFIYGKKEGFELEPWMKTILAIVAGLAFIAAVIWATGVQDKIISLLFSQSWSSAFWSNLLFAAVVVVSMVLLLKPKGKGK
jgi:hypothetical protein